MIRRPPRSTRTDTLFPYTTLFRSRCAEAIQRGELTDTVSPDGTAIPLFVRGNIPNHGVLGRQGAAGYLRRVAAELAARGLRHDDASQAAERMQASSDRFRELRYEAEIAKAGGILARIAEPEIAALEHMQSAWAEVRGRGAATAYQS